MPKGVTPGRHTLPFILADADHGFTWVAREWWQSLPAEWRLIDGQIDATTHTMAQVCAADEADQRLAPLRGLGPLTATALVAAVGDARGFKKGRQLASWLGLVPKHHATGGKPTWLGSSQRGNSSVRQRLIHGARVVWRHLKGNTEAWSRWLQGVEHRRGTHRAGVVHANKVARVAWVLLASGETYRRALGQESAAGCNFSVRASVAVSWQVNKGEGIPRIKFSGRSGGISKVERFACAGRLIVMAPQVRPALPDPENGIDPLESRKC